MAYLTLEELNGSLEVVVFPQVWEQLRAELHEGEVILAQGRIQAQAHRVEAEGEEEEFKLILEHALSLSQGIVLVNVAPQFLERLPLLQQEVAAHRGSSPLFLRLHEPRARATLVLSAPQWWVEYTKELEERITHLLAEPPLFLSQDQKEEKYASLAK